MCGQFGASRKRDPEKARQLATDLTGYMRIRTRFSRSYLGTTALIRGYFFIDVALLYGQAFDKRSATTNSSRDPSLNGSSFSEPKQSSTSNPTRSSIR